MKNYIKPLLLLGLAVALTACGKKAHYPLTALDEYAAELVKQHQSDIQGYSKPFQTLATPLSFVTKFSTSNPAMLTIRSNDPQSVYEKNIVVTEKWQRMYCTDKLKALMREEGIAMASAQIYDATGQDHSMAMCVATTGS